MLPAIISIQKLHICDTVARVQECRVDEVLPSEQQLNSYCCFSLAKQSKLGTPKQSLRDELCADLPEGKRFCFSVSQTISSDIPVQKRNECCFEHSGLNWLSLIQCVA